MLFIAYYKSTLDELLLSPAADAAAPRCLLFSDAHPGRRMNGWPVVDVGGWTVEGSAPPSNQLPLLSSFLDHILDFYSYYL